MLSWKKSGILYKIINYFAHSFCQNLPIFLWLFKLYVIYNIYILNLEWQYILFHYRVAFLNWTLFTYIDIGADKKNKSPMPWVEMITVYKESRNSNRELQCYESSSFLYIKISSTQLHDKAINIPIRFMMNKVVNPSRWIMHLIMIP